MHKFIFFCKTFNGDINYFKNLYQSYLRFNIDQIPLYISIPRVDFELFNRQFKSENVYLVIDEEISEELISNKIGNFTPGYINQQIIKLSFWKKNIAKNYFCIDSDSYFIKNIYYKDFINDENIPYSVLVEDKELCIDPTYYNAYWKSRLDSIKKIINFIELNDRPILTCHNNTTICSDVLRSFETTFMKPKNLKYLDLLNISPFEYSWYNFWLQKSNLIPILPVEPFIKMFHIKEQYLEYCSKQITVNDISRAYIGICMNSSWSKNEKIYLYNFKKKIRINDMLNKFKIYLRDNYPQFFSKLKKIKNQFINKSSEYNFEEEKIEDYEQYLERTIYFRNSPLMKEVFNNKYIVHNGPFEGMNYINKSSGSAFLPKILGSYEEPIQNWIYQIINNTEYTKILDIGCAEGYYAVGFAIKMPNIKIYAYDVNTKAQDKLKEMIELNNVNNVFINGNCTLEELNFRCDRGTLIFCDIEGAEKDLLDPIMASNLSNVDILVESHDCTEEGITDLLISRFFRTHSIEVVIDYPTRIREYNLPHKISTNDLNEVMNEHRSEAMRFLYMKSLKKNN
jgi:hypothetical protein